MPTLSQIRLPIPKDGSEFEDIVVSALRSQNPSVPPQRNGRRGQSQNGVDIYFTDALIRFVGVQCKCVGEFAYTDLVKEVNDAEGFRPELETFIVAIALPRDAKLQKQVETLSQERARGQKFRVGVWFWDDIAADLAKDLTELARHYPDLFGAVATSSARPERLEDDITRQRFAAYQEMWSYLHAQLLPERRRPDEDWDDALDEIALKLGNHYIELSQLHKRYGDILPKVVEESIANAASAAYDGAFEVKLSDDAEIPAVARTSANTVYDLLSSAVDQLRKDFEAHGIRFNVK